MRASSANFNKTYMIKYLIFSCVAAFALVSLTGCASDEKHSSTSESSATTMSPDSKDMNHHGRNNSQ
jgi:hypothetical protein